MIRIKKFNDYIKENTDDLDPYGEEDWGGETNDDMIRRFRSDMFYILPDILEGFHVYSREHLDVLYDDVEEYILNWHGFSDEMTQEKKKEIIKDILDDWEFNGVNENFNELDPYGEEDWDNEELKMARKEYETGYG